MPDKFRHGVFYSLFAGLLFGGGDRVVAWLSDGWLNWLDLVQFFTWLSVAFSLFILFPGHSQKGGGDD